MRQGDEATDRLLRERFRQDSAAFAAPAEPCPDAEILAAYLDRSLSHAEAQAVEAHAASCGPCTQMLAMLVESDPESASTPVLHGTPDEASVGASGPASDRAPVWTPRAESPAPASWWRWGFAIPALAAVLVLGVWLSSMWPGGQPADVTDVMARNEPAAPPSPSEPGAQTATAPGELSRTGNGAASQQARPSAAEKLPARRDETGDALERQVGVAPPAPVDERRSEAPAAPMQQATPAPRPAADTFAKAEAAERDAAPPPAAAASAPAAAAGAPSARAARPVDAVQERERTAAEAQRGARSERQQDALAFAPAPLLLTNGNAGVQWRITGTSIARSNDGGSTWQADFEAPRPVTAGAIAADGTVWLGGRGGLVLRRAASGWTTVTAPAAVDVVGVAEVSATAATVTLADGRRMRTEDGGRTWVAR